MYRFSKRFSGFHVFGSQFFNNVSSIFKLFGHGSGWAGGVTRRAKNSMSSFEKYFQLVRLIRIFPHRIPLGFDFGLTLAPFWLPEGAKRPPRGPK